MAESAPEQRDERVSGKALEPLARLVDEFALGVDAIVEGTALEPHQLASPPGRLSWHDFATIVERIRAEVGEEALRESGRQIPDVPGGIAITRMVSMLASPQAMYAAAPRLGLSTLFPMVEGKFVRVGPTTSRIEATLPKTYKACPGMFEISAGNFEVVPVLLGLPPAVVDLSSDGHVAVFTIEHGMSTTLWARFKNIFKLLFSPRSLFDELTTRNTELARQLSENAAARQRADRAVAAQNDLLTAVSHELRTPVGEVRGLVELALQTAESPETRKHLHTAIRSADRLTHTVDMLIQVAALGDVAAERSEEALDLGPFVKAVVASFGHAQIRRGVRAPEAGEGCVRLPPDWVRSVVHELVSNAYRFTERGRIDVEVDLLDGEAGSEVHIRVTDTGIGLEAAWHDRVFEPFVQRDSGLGRRTQGVGLGLTVVKALVDRMNGEITLYSRRGKGTTVHVVLPCERAQADDDVRVEFGPDVPTISDHLAAYTPAPSTPRAEAVRPVGGTPIPACATPGQRLLVVDDNPVNRLLLSSLGKRLGYQVKAVDGGEAALEALIQQDFDLVFMDVQMPGMDGLQTTLRLREQPELRHLPVIAVTAQVAPGDEARCRVAGMDAYVPKPVEVQRLREAIDEAVAAAAERRVPRAS